jgi:hypothetical protein
MLSPGQLLHPDLWKAAIIEGVGMQGQKSHGLFTMLIDSCRSQFVAGLLYGLFIRRPRSNYEVSMLSHTCPRGLDFSAVRSSSEPST